MLTKKIDQAQHSILIKISILRKKRRDNLQDFHKRKDYLEKSKEICTDCPHFLTLHESRDFCMSYTLLYSIV